MGGDLSAAETALHACEELLTHRTTSRQKVSNGDPMSQQIVEHIQAVVPFMVAVAEANPMAKVAVSLFKEIVELEARRRDNNEQIVAVAHTMTTAIFALRHLNDVTRDSSHISIQVEREIAALTVTINGFGNFCDLYYNRMQSRTMRFLRANDIKGQLEKHLREFHERRIALETLLVVKTHADVRDVLKQTSQILDLLSAPSSAAETKAALRVVELGGYSAVRQDAEKVQEIKVILAEEMAGLWTDTLDELLSDNLVNFESTLGAELTNLAATLVQHMDDQTRLVTNAFQAGRHDFLYDEELRTIWRENHWDDLVDGDVFVEVVLSRYESAVAIECFNGTQEVTAVKEIVRALQTRSTYDRLIGAIDENHSGNISLAEALHFLSRKPEKITIAGWFIFWAIGWREAIARDLDTSRKLLDRILNVLSKRAQLHLASEEDRLSAYRDRVLALKAACTYKGSEDMLNPGHPYSSRAYKILDLLRARFPGIPESDGSSITAYADVDSFLTSNYGTDQMSFISLLPLCLPSHLSSLQSFSPVEPLEAITPMTSHLGLILQVAEHRMLESCGECRRAVLCLGDQERCDVCLTGDRHGDDLEEPHTVAAQPRGNIRAIADSIVARGAPLALPDRIGAVFINDPDIQKIWNDNPWGYLASPEVFIHAVHVHFVTVIPDHERWITRILGNPANRRIMTGALNSTAFDYISPHDINLFLDQKPRWCSTPVWFAFWGSGWSILNQRFTHRVRSLCKRILSSCNVLRSSDPSARFTADQLDCINKYARLIQLLSHVTPWRNPGDWLGDQGDTDTRTTVAALSARMAEHFEKDLHEKVKIFYQNNPPETVPSLDPKGCRERDVRLEKIFPLVVSMVLETQADAIDNAPAYDGSTSSDIVKICTRKLEKLLRAFDQRVTSILDHYQNHARRPDVYFREHAWGLLDGWYKHVNAIARLKGDSEPDASPSPEGARPPKVPEPRTPQFDAGRPPVTEPSASTVPVEFLTLVTRLEAFGATSGEWQRIAKRLEDVVGSLAGFDVENWAARERDNQGEEDADTSN